MIRKSAHFTQAAELRKRHFTYAEIARIVGISKSTVHNWFSRETWSKSITNENQKHLYRANSKRISLLNTSRSNQLKKHLVETERMATLEFKHYKNNPLFIAGVMLYTNIGDIKQNNPIRIASVKPELHRVFVTFAIEFLGVPREKVRFWLLLYSDHDPEKCSRLWSKKIKVPLSQFHKYQVTPEIHTHQTLHFGVGNTIIGDTVSKRKLLTWSKLLLKDL